MNLSKVLEIPIESDEQTAVYLVEGLLKTIVTFKVTSSNQRVHECSQTKLCNV